MPLLDGELIDADMLQPAEIRAVVPSIQVPLLDVLYRIPRYPKQGCDILDGHHRRQLTDVSLELMRVPAFARGEVDRLVQFLSAVLALEAEHRLYQYNRLGTDGDTTELSLRFPVMHDMAAATMCTAEFVLTRFDFKLNHVIFVSCSGALLVSQTQCLVHKAGMHVILDWWCFQR